MFTDYFVQQTDKLQKSYQRKGKQQELSSSSSSSGKKKKLKTLEDFYIFLRDHIPSELSLATGKVRNRNHILQKNCDLLVYHKWCENYLKVSGGCILSESLKAFMSIEGSLTASALLSHVDTTRALKTLYSGDLHEPSNQLIPMYSILFGYGSGRSLAHIKRNLLQLLEDKGIPINQQVDMICILGKGLIVKDWSNADYRGIETKKDTLMWFYILLIEYLEQENSFQPDLRDYVKNTKKYDEF